MLDLFRKSGALLEGHFRLSSGLHSSGYMQSALVLQHPQHAERLGQAIADQTRNLRPSVVLSPALGGVVIGHEVARALGVRAIFAERQDGALVLRNPILVASGTFGYGVEYGEVVDVQRLGAICCKGTTLKARVGNPPPRVTETPGGMLNSIGLQNPGIDAVLEKYEIGRAHV